MVTLLLWNSHWVNKGVACNIDYHWAGGVGGGGRKSHMQNMVLPLKTNEVKKKGSYKSVLIVKNAAEQCCHSSTVNAVMTQSRE